MRVVVLCVAAWVWVLAFGAMDGSPAPSAPPAPSAAAPQAPAPVESLIISDLHIVGNKRIPALQIVEAFGIKPGSPFKPSDAAAGIERINQLGYFFEDKTTYESGITDKGVILTLHVEELPVLSRVVVENSHVLKDEEIVRLMNLKAGEILNWNEIRKGIDAVNAEFARRGYPSPFFQASPGVNPDTGELTVSVQESRVESIEIEQSHKTRRWVLLSQIHTKPGDYVNSNEIQKDAYRMGNLGILEDLPEVGVRSGSKLGWVVLVFKIKEAKTGRFTFGAGYGQTTGFSVTASISENNWRGLAQTLSAALSIGSRVNTYDLSFRDPLFRRTHDTFNFGLFRTQNILNFRNTQVSGSANSRYTTTQTGGSVLIDHPFRKAYVFSYGLDSRDQKLRLEKGGTELTKEQKQKEGLTEGRIDSVSLGIARDTRMDRFDAFQGTRNGLDTTLGFSFLGADFDYSRYVLDLRRYVSVTRSHRWVVAARLKTGAAFGSVPATDQFYVGGTDTVRGYEFGRLRGFKMGLLNLELRYRAQPVGGVVFLDAGDAGPSFATDPSGNLIQQKFKIQNTIFGVGAGIRFKIPQLSNLPVRLDFGYNLERGGVRFHFGFGQLF